MGMLLERKPMKCWFKSQINRFDKVYCHPLVNICILSYCKLRFFKQKKLLIPTFGLKCVFADVTIVRTISLVTFFVNAQVRPLAECLAASGAQIRSHIVVQQPMRYESAALCETSVALFAPASRAMKDRNENQRMHFASSFVLAWNGGLERFIAVEKATTVLPLGLVRADEEPRGDK